MVHILCSSKEEQLDLKPAHTLNTDPAIFSRNNPQPARTTSLQDVPLVLCIEDLMAVLSVGRNTAYEIIRSGQIRSIRVGKQIRIPRDELEQYLQRY